MDVLGSQRFKTAAARDWPRLEQLQRALAAASKAIEIVLVTVCGLLLAAIVGTVFLEVVIRYVVQAPLPWTEEVARFCLVWFGMLSAAAAAHKGLHFSFRWGLMALGDKARRGTQFAVTLVVMGFLGVLLWQSYAFLDIVSNQSAMATNLDMAVPYGGIPVGIGALLIIYLLEAADVILSIWTGKQLGVKATLEERLRRDELLGEEELSLPLVVPGLEPRGVPNG